MFCVVQEQREERSNVIAGDGGERRGAGEVRDDGGVQRLFVRSAEGGDRVRDFWDEGWLGGIAARRAERAMTHSSEGTASEQHAGRSDARTVGGCGARGHARE